MRVNIWLKRLLPPAVIIPLLAIFWNWDWFVPLIDAEASASLGHKVTIQHLHVALGRTATIAATSITIANPSGFPTDEAQLASIDRMLVNVDVMESIEHRTLSLTSVEVDHPVVNIRQLPDGTSNYPASPTSGSSTHRPPKFGDIIINNGSASIVMPRLNTDFTLAIQTRPAPPGDKLFTGGEILVDAEGTYDNAPITGQFIGGDLLSLRASSAPYPVYLSLQNGATQVSLTGTIDAPEALTGMHLRLSVSGQNMADLYQLTGMPIPATPPFSLTGDLNYAQDTFRFENFTGQVGASDLEGAITEAHGPQRLMVTADLTSNRVNLSDLAGFLGGTPGETTTPGQTAAARKKIEEANASPNLLPDTKFNLSEINAADVDLRYHAAHIVNRNTPFDNLTVHLTIDNGHITADPLNFAVGTGAIASNFDLTPVDGVLHTRANIVFKDLPLSRLMATTHTAAGDGTIRGSASLTGTGNSVAQILGGGNGHAALFMRHGVYASTHMLDIGDLHVNDAIRSALGVPVKTNIQCMVSDFALTDGLVQTKTFLLATPKANILGTGTINLATEKINLALRTEATHFSVGSLSTPINVGGTLKTPSIRPAALPLAESLGQEVQLGMMFPPLAILPTIRLGLGDKNACADTITALEENDPHNPK